MISVDFYASDQNIIIKIMGFNNPLFFVHIHLCINFSTEINNVQLEHG